MFFIQYFTQLSPFKKYSLVVIGLLLISNVLKAQEIIYHSPDGLAPSEAFKVKKNGRNAFVYASTVPAAYCSFDMKGNTQITIQTNQKIKSVTIRPLALGIMPVVTYSTIVFFYCKTL